MDEELEETSLRHRTAASRHHHHRRRAKKPPPTTNYDDVFGGPPKHAVPFSGVPDDYAEVFGGVSVSCSIPFLDLPTGQTDGWDCAGGESVNGVEYGEIFGRRDFSDFAVPYEELFGRGKSDEGEMDMHFASANGRSSVKGRSGPQTIDPSAFIQEYSNEDNIPYLEDANFSVASDEIPKEYNTSYKLSRTRAKELLHTTASVPQPQTGFTFVIEPNKPLPEHLLVVNEDTVTHESSVKPNPKSSVNSQSISCKEPVLPGVPFLDVADVNLLTRSANMPPPSLPPPPKTLINERQRINTFPKTDSVSNISTEAEQPPLPQQEKPKPFLKSDSLPPNFDFVPNLKLDKREKPKLKSRPNTFSKSESLPPGFGSELDAMKEAMEFAQARLKTAKELHEKRREGKITELPLKKKHVKEENLEGSEGEKLRVLRSISLASNFSKSREFMKVQGVVVATQGARELEKSGKWRSDEEFHELTSIEPTKERENKAGIPGTVPLVETNREFVQTNGLPSTEVGLTGNLNADVNDTENLELAGEIKDGEDLKREEKTTIGALDILTGSQEPVIELEKETGEDDTEASKEDANGILKVEDIEYIGEVEVETDSKGYKMKVGVETEEEDRKGLDEETKRQRERDELEKERQREKEIVEEEKERAHKLEEEKERALQLEKDKERAHRLEEEEKERKLQMEREEKERREQERIMAEEEERLERERMKKWEEESGRESFEKEREEKQRTLAEEREIERKLEEERQEEKMREKEMVRKLEEEKERERKLEEEIEKERERVRKLEEEREQERERVRKLEEEKQREREMARKLEKDKERERKLEEEIEKERQRIRKLEEEREWEREKVRKLEEEREVERERVRKLEEEREQERERVRKIEEEREKERIEKERERKEREKIEQEREHKERERIVKEREQKEMEKKLEEEKEKLRMEKEKEEREKLRRMEKEREEKEMAMRLEAEMRRLERERAEEKDKTTKLQGEKVNERKTEARKSDEERERDSRRMKEKERKTEGRKSDEDREKAWERKSDEERERVRDRRGRKEREIEEREREREEEERKREREKDRLAMERATQERAERIAIERITAARQRAVENREKEEMNNRGGGEGFEKKRSKGEEEKKEREGEKNARDARLRAERAAVERATAEARERAIEKAKAGAEKERDRLERFKSFSRISSQDHAQEAHFKRTQSDSALSQGHGESALRHKARLERQQRTAERAAKALAEKNRRDIMAQREQAERDRIAEHLDADVKRWSSGKEGNLRALLSTLQYILGQNSGWQPIHLTEVITAADVKKAYRKATLYVHPDKLQQRGASIQQKYICEKVFDLLKEAWNKFNSEER